MHDRVVDIGVGFGTRQGVGNAWRVFDMDELPQEAFKRGISSRMINSAHPLVEVRVNCM